MLDRRGQDGRAQSPDINYKIFSRNVPENKNVYTTHSLQVGYEILQSQCLALSEVLCKFCTRYCRRGGLLSVSESLLHFLGNLLNVKTVFIAVENNILQRIQQSTLPKDIMSLKNNVRDHSRKRTKHVELQHAKQARYQTFIVCCCNWSCVVHGRLIRIALDHCVCCILRVLPASFTRLDKPFVQVEASPRRVVWYANLYRLLRRTLRDQLGLCFETTSFQTVELTRFVDNRYVCSWLHKPSRSRRYYVHAYTVHTVLLPQKTESGKLVIVITV